MKENEIRSSSNSRMKKPDQTNDKLSNQIQEDDKKDNDELFPRSPKNLKQCDMELLNHGDGNKNVNDQSNCNMRSSKRSAAIDADWRRRELNQFNDGDD